MRGYAPKQQYTARFYVVVIAGALMALWNRDACNYKTQTPDHMYQKTPVTIQIEKPNPEPRPMPASRTIDLNLNDSDNLVTLLVQPQHQK